METKQVIVIRKDLNMRKGKMVAQGAHAAMGALLHYMQQREPGYWEFTPPEEVEAWLNSSFTKICVSVDSEFELLKIYKKAQDANIPRSLIEDNGKTEFNGEKTFTAVAVGPAEIDKVDKITGKLRLI